MTGEGSAVARAYLERMTPGDVRLVQAAAGPVGDLVRDGPDRALAADAVFEAVFSPAHDADPLLLASPFLVFAVAVQRTAVDLGSMSYVPEWLGPGRSAPVFDVAELRQFLAGSWRKLFLAELLASYTHVASGSVVVMTRRGMRRRRFSEMDPVRLAGLLEVVPEAERPGILRRLGDLALFLTGVFPDHVARKGFGSVGEARLLRAVAGGGPAAQPATGPFGDGGAVGLLERLGPRWYKAAFDLLPRPVPADVGVLGELPQRFHQARRVLGVVTERHLFPHRSRWFGTG